MIAVVRAEEFYLPPPELSPDSWVLLPPAERVWRWVEYKQQRRVTPPEGVLLGVQLWARINHNRWLADCPCGSAQVATPADPRFACTECGYGWAALVFPEDPAAVEDALAELLPHERNWTHPDAPPPARVVPPSPPRKGAR
ncbi:hypothetical protein AB0D99_10690 [Streptomyces sp. NPDC047971]|uniref:hypothetical protein n=1 Tax=Streptomyces sp. NPDC047971 TaxID=3154499 RepID=UPI0033EC2ECB